jgi:hypothetical protein
MTDICPVPKIAGEEWSSLFAGRAPAFASAASGRFFWFTDVPTFSSDFNGLTVN